MKDLYEILGVARTATHDQIRKSYRKKAMKMHPDHGGDPAAFRELVLAHKVLSDPDKRARYDAGESAETISQDHSKDNQITSMLVEIFMSIITKRDPKHVDIFAEMRKHIAGVQSELEKLVSREKEMIEKFENAQKRVKAKGSSNLFAEVLAAQASRCREQILAHEKNKTLGADAIRFLEDYAWEVEALPPEQQGAQKSDLSDLWRIMSDHEENLFGGFQRRKRGSF